MEITLRGKGQGVGGRGFPKNPHPSSLTPRPYKGSVTIEYAAFIAILIAALLGMSIYIKRALEGRWRQVGDAFGQGRQYEPGVTVVSH